jgi:hypothetical protein
MIARKLSAMSLAVVMVLLLGASGRSARRADESSQADEEAALMEKLRNAMGHITTLSTALTDYITDHGRAPSQDGGFDADGNFYEDMVPFYLAELSPQDPWGGRYLVYCGTSCNGKYGMQGCAENDFLIVCLGKDGKGDGWEFDNLHPQAGLYKLNAKDDFDKDLVNWNGSWVHAPGPEDLRKM